MTDYPVGAAVTHSNYPGEVWAIRCQGVFWINTSGRDYTDTEASQLIELGAWKLVDPGAL